MVEGTQEQQQTSNLKTPPRKTTKATKSPRSGMVLGIGLQVTNNFCKKLDASKIKNKNKNKNNRQPPMKSITEEEVDTNIKWMLETEKELGRNKNIANSSTQGQQAQVH